MIIAVPLRTLALLALLALVFCATVNARPLDSAAFETVITDGTTSSNPFAYIKKWFDRSNVEQVKTVNGAAVIIGPFVEDMDAMVEWEINSKDGMNK